MKVALIGYGKMGKTIERILIDRGHEVTMRISGSNISEFTRENLHDSSTDIAIEFSNPESAYDNYMTLLDAGIPIVSGTTGWLSEWDKVVDHLRSVDGSFIYASNFSIGVNIFFEVNKILARIMDKHPQYHPSMEEIHHTSKKDAPSGTGITLAETIIDEVQRIDKYVNAASDDPRSLELISKRIDPAPGTHTIQYTSSIDEISITHEAKGREGFALGAVLAAEFLVDKKGIYTMKDVLQIQ